MTTIFSQKNHLILAILPAVMLCSAISGYSQTPQRKSGENKKKASVVITVKKDGDKTTVIDTTFDLSSPEGQKKFEAYMKQHENEMNETEKAMEEMEVNVQIPEGLDSLGLAMDSIGKKIEVIARKGRHPQFFFHSKPGESDFDFEFPDVPPPPSLPEEFEYKIQRGWSPDRRMHIMPFERGGESLSDLLGDIPMDRVKSYSIKDRKGGKRIIIDIEDAPLIEKRDRVIILQGPGRTPRPGSPKKMERKVIIKEDGDKM